MYHFCFYYDSRLRLTLLQDLVELWSQDERGTGCRLATNCLVPCTVQEISCHVRLKLL